MAIERVAVVTGGAQGIGLGIARCLTAAGYAPALWDRNREAAVKAADDLRKVGASAIGVGCDVRDYEAVSRALDETKRRLGTPYLLVNNAAVRHRAALEDLSRSDWDNEIATNLTGAFQCTQTIGREMLENRSGVIVNISSMAGSLGYPGRGAYSPTKAGILGLTYVTAVEWGGRGIRCNAISPGIIVTPAFASIYADPLLNEGRRAMVPLGRLGEPADIGDVVVFLASDAARYINGANVPVDGGTTQALLALVPVTRSAAQRVSRPASGEP